MRKLHIVVYMMYWYPYEGPLQPIYGRIIRDLIAKGHKVTIVSSFPHRRPGMNRHWKQYRGKFFHKTEWKGATHYMTWVFAPYCERGICKHLSRIFSYLTFHLSSFWVMLRHVESPELLFFPSSPPVSNGVIGCWLSRLKKAPFIYNVQDMYPQVAVGKGLLSKGSMLEKIIQKIENRTYLQSKRTILLAETMRDIVENELGLPGDKFLVIPNFVDDSHIRPEPKINPFSERLNLNDKFIVLYAGNLGVAHDYTIIIDAVEFLKKKEDILFLFVSRGVNIPNARKMVEEKQLANVIFLDYQPGSLVSSMYASADASIVTLKPEYARTVIPSKTLSIMASQRPVLGVLPHENPMADLIQKSQCGFLIQPGDSQGLAEAILQLYADSNLRQTLGYHGRQYLKDHYSHTAITQEYENVFMRAVAE